MLLCLAVSFPSALSALEDIDGTYNKMSFTPISPLPAGGGAGVSGAFAGMCGQSVVVAGGCNFPGKPAAQGGQKVFYNDIYAISHPLGTSEWRRVGELPKPLAYGAGVQTPSGVVCIGGTADGKSAETSVFLLTMEGGKASMSGLPSLPMGLVQAAAAYGGGYVYVAGGLSGGVASAKAFRLKFPGGKAWEVLPDMPGAARVQPAAAYQAAALGGKFYVFGGFDPVAKKTATGGVAYDPSAGLWAETAPSVPHGESSPVAIVGAAAVASGCDHIVFFGGVDRKIFEEAISLPAPDYLEHEPEWYAFSKDMLVYHTVTDTWARSFSNPLFARAGASVVEMGRSSGSAAFVVTGGELKPGVRSAKTTVVDLSYNAKFGLANWAVLVAYQLGMLLIGAYFMRRTGSSSDFFTGGGRIPWWAAGVSIFATMLSAITYMSIPAKAYATDWTYYPMQIMILLVAFPVIRYYLPFFRRLNMVSAYEYLERRFNYATRLMASLLFIVFMVARMALVLYLPSLAMAAVTGIDIFACIVIMSVITIVYCTMGGMEAVVWGDVVQGFILVGGAVLAACYLVFGTEGGFGGFVEIASAEDKMRLFDWSFDYRSATFWVIILGGIGNNLISYTSDQTVIQRYLTTKDEKGAAKGIITNGLMSVFVSISFYLIGTGLYTFFKTHPGELDLTMARPDAIFTFFMMSQLPAGLAGLLIAALFAATMSTISSNINSISTAFTMDVYKKAKPGADDAHLLLTARWVGIVSGLAGTAIAVFMAVADIQSLLDYFNTILGLLSGGVGGLFIIGIFLPRVGAKAALAGFVSGTAVVFYMNYFTAVNFFLFGITSMAVSVAVAVALSPLLPNRKDGRGLSWGSLEK